MSIMAMIKSKFDPVPDSCLIAGMKIMRAQDLENLVFKGGSVKGVAYVGALGALDTIFKEKGLDFRTQLKNVGGTSAGAITAMLIALNCSIDEVIDYLINTDLKSFLHSSESRVRPKHLFKGEDQSAISATQMLAGAIMDINEKFGLYSGGKFQEWVEEVVKKKTGIDNCTFGELHSLILSEKGKDLGFRDLHVIGFNLTSNTTNIFNFETTPDSVISDAVRISMSIPIIFLPYNNYIKVGTSVDADGKTVEAHKEILNEDLWVDGGLTNNYPVRIFDNPDYNPHTLGFYFVSPEEKAVFEGHVRAPDCIGLKREIKNGFDYVRALFESVIDAQQIAAHLGSRDPERTVYINHLNVSGLNFGLTLEEKQNLVDSGWEAVYQKFGMELVPCPIKIKDEDVVDSNDAGKGVEGSPEKNVDRMKELKERCVIA